MTSKKPKDVVREVSECKGGRNPCKICLKEVNHKNGVVCQGACRTWVHFKCLNYTPGKIADIKKGYLSIACPCNNCTSTDAPKEYLHYKEDVSYTCNNLECPANNPASCTNYDCVANELSRLNPPCCPPAGTLRQCQQGLCFEYSAEKGAANTAIIPKKPEILPICGYPQSIGSGAEAGTGGGGPPDDFKGYKVHEMMHTLCTAVEDLAKQMNAVAVSVNPNAVPPSS